MGWVLFFGAVGVVSLGLSGLYLSLKKERAIGLILLIVGMVCVFMMSRSADAIKDGSPATEISPGVYKVAFVHRAGENVSVGIERQKDGKEHLFLYQFPTWNFEWNVCPDAGAKEIVVYEETTINGTFKKYTLR